MTAIDPTKKIDPDTGEHCGGIEERPVPPLPAELPEERKKPAKEPKGTGTARERVTDVNPVDTGERGTTGPAAI